VGSVWGKAESLLATGSVKLRGALAANQSSDIVMASTGNHAAAVLESARISQVGRLIIFVPETISPVGLKDKEKQSSCLEMIVSWPRQRRCF
jgi:threonine dehydratase